MFELQAVDGMAVRILRIDSIAKIDDPVSDIPCDEITGAEQHGLFNG
jgi:hypothetical protein